MTHFPRLIMRQIATLAVALVVLASPATAADVRTFLAKTCVDCHGPDTQEGGVRFDTLPLDAKGLASSPDAIHSLIRAHDRIRNGEMPPKDAEQPSAADRAAFVAAIAPVIEAGEAEAAAGTGRGTIRRLNRTEYEFTLRDLFSLPSLRVKDLLPEDARRENFDKVAGGLDISYVQMTKYLEGATEALGQATVTARTPPKRSVWREPAIAQLSIRGAVNQKCLVPIDGHELAAGYVTGIAGDPVNNAGNSYRWAKFDGNADSAAVLTGEIGAHQPEGVQIDRFNPPVPGLYIVRFSIWGLRWARTKAEPARPGNIVCYNSLAKPFFQNDKGKWEATPADDDTKNKAARTAADNLDAVAGDGTITHIVRASLRGRPLGYFDALSLEPKVHEFEAWLAPGDRISFHSMTLPASGPLGGPTNDGVRDYEGPGIAYDWFEVEGPLDDSWPPPSQRRLFGTTPVEKYPRPSVVGCPTVGGSADAVIIPLADVSGVGHRLESEWLLNVAGDITTTVNFAKPGRYELRVTGFQTPAGDAPAEAWLLYEGREIPRSRFKVEALRDAPQTLRKEFVVNTAGSATVGVRFPNDLIDEKTSADRNLVITKVEIAPLKLDDAGSPETPTPAALLTDFAAAAFRRPVAPSEVEAYVRLAEQQLALGEPFKEAMFAGYRAVLCAPDFLLVGLESGLPRVGAAPAPLGPHALASRLSYFLWDSLPDRQLLDLAETGELLKLDVLSTEVDRMLADPKSERFVEHFLDEWLKLHEIDFTTPDTKLYPEFDPWLRDSMLAETRATFRRLLDENLSVTDLIDSDTVMINQRLALHYGMPLVRGAAIRPCPVPDGVPRGGLLTQASVHKVTANGTATSPVLRGVWAMERLLGVPRLPPPQNIPAIEPDATGATTIRQMLEMHRADATCAACHARMDPYGLALEAFDPIGGHRDRYRLSGTPKKVRKGKETITEPFADVLTFASSAHRNRIQVRLGSLVDPSGTLADGRSFDDVEELKRLLLVDPDAVAANMARQLTIYATGTPIRFSDRDEIERIVAATKPTKHGLKAIVKQVVASDLFRTK